MEKVVIIDALRTPVGKFRGSLSEFQAVDLGTFVTKELIKRNKEVAKEIDYVTFGHVLQAGTGQNTARQVVLSSGLPVSVPAVTINEVCGSGMKAIAHARQLLQLGEAKVVVAGGMESMTNAPSVSYFDKQSESYSKPKAVMMVDGLSDAFSGKAMGLTAENVAEKYGVTRDQQDTFAYHSQRKGKIANEEGWFLEEIIPITLGSGQYYAQDEGIRPQTTKEKLQELKPVFKGDGSVTAGNSSTINDGASAMLLCTESYAIEQGLAYLAVIEDIVEVGIEPEIMGISPITAITKLMKRNNLALDQIDLFEINEAFAASSIVVEKELDLDGSKVNVAGGGISLGHAIGASGARIVTTLVHQLRRTKQQTGIASLCVGGGIGLALLLQVPKNKKKKEIVPNSFYKQSPEQRRATLVKDGRISEQEAKKLSQQNLEEQIADHLIENQVSDFPLPLGIGLNIQINDKKYVVPMVTEEPSVIAACSFGAKMANQTGGFNARMNNRLLRGQMVFSQVANRDEFIHQVDHYQSKIKQIASEAYPSIVQRGGGLREIQIRTFDEQPSYVSVDLLLDTQEAMGANMMNTILEKVASSLEQLTGESCLISILSNYATESIVQVECQIPVAALSKTSDGKQIALKIEEASLLAQMDPYRAVTHNKGIMNGVEAFVLATGNDTRAMSAAIHAYAAREGQYKGLSEWSVKNEYLIGTIELPLLLASVGGATTILPKARIVHTLLGNPSAKELAMIGGAVGLAQNLAALRALVSEGIQKGHMSLQARSLAMSVGAVKEEIQQVAEMIKKETKMNQETAKKCLEVIRNKQEKNS